MNRSNIEWTDATWNPVVGCTRVSEACDHCYAVGMSHRLGSMALADEEAGRDPGRKAVYRGLTVLNNRGDRHFNGEVRCVPEALDEPLRWRAPRMVFTASMSDIFHERVPFEFVFRMLAVMALTPHHTYQVLTKRPERVAECLNLPDIRSLIIEAAAWLLDRFGHTALSFSEVAMLPQRLTAGGKWPLPNVWLGCTVETQRWADERIPHLLRCPAAVRFVSCEPLLGELDLEPFISRDVYGNWCCGAEMCSCKSCLIARNWPYDAEGIFHLRPDWVIAGGEQAAAAKARPTADAWLRSLRDQCRAAGVPFFCKQRTERGRKIPLEQWPEDLRVREWPDNRPDSRVAASHEGRRAEARGG